MKILCLLIVLLASATWRRAADPEGFGLWKGAAIKNSGKELAGKIDDQKFSFQSLGTYANHMIGISPREGNGSAELHETQTDVLIVDTGAATLIVGGTMVNQARSSHTPSSRWIPTRQRRTRRSACTNLLTAPGKPCCFRAERQVMCDLMRKIRVIS